MPKDLALFVAPSSPLLSKRNVFVGSDIKSWDGNQEAEASGEVSLERNLWRPPLVTPGPPLVLSPSPHSMSEVALTQSIPPTHTPGFEQQRDHSAYLHKRLTHHTGPSTNLHTIPFISPLGLSQSPLLQIATKHFTLSRGTD